MHRLLATRVPFNSASALQASAEARLSDYIVASQAAATSAFDFALSNAQKAVTDQQAAVNEASQAVTAATAAAQSQQAVVTSAQQAASEAAQQVAADASAVAAAQQRLEDLKNNTTSNGTDVTKAAQLQSSISQLQAQLTQDKQAAQNAQQMLEAAQQNFASATAAQQAATEKVEQTQAALSQAQEAVTTAQANAEAAQQKVAEAKAAAEQALTAYQNYKAEMDSVPVVETPSDIIEKYEEYSKTKTNDSSIKQDCESAITLNGGDASTGFMATGWVSGDGGKTWTPTLKTNYEATDQDKAETVDPRNMTADQQTEITEFAAEIVNNLREVFQSSTEGAKYSYGKVMVSPYATELGNKVIDSAYNNSGWNKLSNSLGTPHNEDGMMTAANAEGLNTVFVGENLSTGLLLDTTGTQINRSMSMAEVKESIYAGILAMVYQDVEQNDGDSLHLGFGGHTSAFLNDPTGPNGIAFYDNGNQYMTVTIDKDGWVHYNFFDDGRASQTVKDKLAEGATTPDSSTVAAEVNSTHETYLQKQATADSAAQAASAAQTGLQTAQTNLASAEAAAKSAAAAQTEAESEATNQKAIMANAQAAVDIANQDVEKLQQQLNEVQAELDAINGTVQDKAQQLAQAQTDLAAAQEKLASSKDTQTSRDSAVTDATNELTELQQAVQDKQNDLQEAQSELQNKKNEYSQMSSQMRLAQVFDTSLAAVSPKSDYEQAINDAKKVVAQAQTKLTTDTQAYNDSQTKLQELTANVSQLKTIYQAALSNAKKSDAVQNDTAVKNAKTALSTAQLKVQVENGKLTQLKGTLEKDQASLDAANGELTKAQEKLSSLQSELQRAQITFDGLSNSYVPASPASTPTTSDDEASSSVDIQTPSTSAATDEEVASSETEDTTTSEASQEETVAEPDDDEAADVQQVVTNELVNPGSLGRTSQQNDTVKSEIAAQIAARNAHAANDNMMAGYDDPYDNYYDQQQEAASIPSAPFEGYTRQLGALKNNNALNAQFEAAIKSGQIKLPSSDTKSTNKSNPKVNKDSITAMTVIAAGATLATGASLSKKRKKQAARKLQDNDNE